ncbi:NDR1/HIN1-like protein 6 [Phoenix dactylifera]|uniref:NDR1/HIN1-like protein 6 n=1 Tax=Phoenix dactylifera TaxID=42345 RepID=A0A8B7CF09_PHODC|nr:NDR1/HIN1-like protein 6 [Phoenix dactylifera]
MVLAEQGGDSPLRPPPHRRNLPRYHSHRSSSSCSCRCCWCWCCCFLLLVLVIVIAITAYISLIIKPRVPTYSVDDFSIGDLNLNPTDLTIRTKFIVTVRAKNPNDMIGIWYKNGSYVAISYRNTLLCSGCLPSFYQGHHNTTVMRVVLEGQSKLGAEVHGVLEENRRTGRIPLDVFVRVPVGLRVFNIDWRQVTVNVTCALVVDGLSPDKKVGIKSADYKVDVDL